MDNLIYIVLALYEKKRTVRSSNKQGRVYAGLHTIKDEERAAGADTGYGEMSDLDKALRDLWQQMQKQGFMGAVFLVWLGMAIMLTAVWVGGYLR